MDFEIKKSFQAADDQIDEITPSERQAEIDRINAMDSMERYLALPRKAKRLIGREYANRQNRQAPSFMDRLRVTEQSVDAANRRFMTKVARGDHRANQVFERITDMTFADFEADIEAEKVKRAAQPEESIAG